MAANVDVVVVNSRELIGVQIRRRRRTVAIHPVPDDTRVEIYTNDNTCVCDIVKALGLAEDSTATCFGSYAMVDLDEALPVVIARLSGAFDTQVRLI